MIHKTRSLSAILASALGLAAAAGPGSRTYVPPPEPGYIYVVVGYDPAASGTEIVARWGSWSRSGRFEPPPGAGGGGGVVLRLTHRHPDSVPLTVTTTGRFLAGPFQGEAPPEWETSRFLRVVW